jgi:hypothetical protein
MKARQDIEELRIFAALGIVWYHSQVQGKNIAYTGLVIFLILAVFLSGDNSKPVFLRAKRLLVPWIIWFAFYGFLRLCTHNSLIPLENGVIAGILTGPRSHLWFLPFIFLVLIAIDGLKHKVGQPTLGYCGAGLAILTLVSSPIWREVSIRSGYPWAQYAQAAAGVFIGIFFFSLHAMQEWSIIPLFLIVLLASAAAIGLPGVGVPYLIGVGSCLLLLRNPKQTTSFQITSMSQCMFGVYLLHPFFLTVASRLGFPNNIWLPVTVFLCSWLIVWVFRKLFPKLSRYIV